MGKRLERVDTYAGDWFEGSKNRGFLAFVSLIPGFGNTTTTTQLTKTKLVLNHKSITPEDELADALEDMARDIALIEPNPVDWGWWAGYLLEQMESQAEKRRLTNQYEHSLKVLVDKLQNRTKGRKW